MCKVYLASMDARSREVILEGCVLLRAEMAVWCAVRTGTLSLPIKSECDKGEREEGYMRMSLRQKEVFQT